MIIVDAEALANLKTEWAGAVRMLERMKSLVVVTFAGGAITGPALAKVIYNLPLLLAHDVLRQVLQQLRVEGQFTCSSNQLGALVDAAKASASLSWLDWQGVRDSVHRRNEVAHDGVLFESTVCVADITRIEQQLVAWKVV